MDWLHISSIAITVLVALGIYRCERIDISRRNKKSHIVDTAARSMQLMGSISATVTLLNSLMERTPETQFKDARTSSQADFIKSAALCEELTVELNNNLFILKNISTFESSEIEEQYFEDVQKLNFGEFFTDPDNAKERIKTIKKSSEEINNRLQLVFKENIE